MSPGGLLVSNHRRREKIGIVQANRVAPKTSERREDSWASDIQTKCLHARGLGDAREDVFAAVPYLIPLITFRKR